uniref:Uncharacterized protein n=1 Tax=Triticum urartu TaxID=4572 RepID=A0A8R7QFM7_TRIUA
MPGRQVLRCVMPDQQVLRTTNLPKSSRLDGRARCGGTGAMMASADGRTDKDDADLSQDGSAV